MIIILKDGSELKCNKIEIWGNIIVVDEYRRVSIFDVSEIVSNNVD